MRGCVPVPVVTIYTDSSDIDSSIVYSSNNTIVTGSINTTDSITIHCTVLILNTNYTHTVQYYYTRYTQVIAKPYTSIAHCENCIVNVFIFMTLAVIFIHWIKE